MVALRVCTLVHSFYMYHRKMPAWIRETVGSRRPCLHHITHRASPYLHRRSLYGADTIKQTFIGPTRTSCSVADLQIQSINSVNTDVAMPYPCGHFPVYCSHMCGRVIVVSLCVFLSVSLSPSVNKFSCKLWL